MPNQADDPDPEGSAKRKRGGPIPARVVVLLCLASIGYIGLFAIVDSFLETYAETPQQMLVRLAVVSMALIAWVAIVIYLLERAQVAHERAERMVQRAEEDARLGGALLAMRELAPWLAQENPHLAMSVRRASLPFVSSSITPIGSLLTPREREVAILIAQGRTSREIAVELVITERTADTHADRIRTKLGVRSRAEIVAWVVSQGLLSASNGRGVSPTHQAETVEAVPEAGVTQASATHAVTVRRISAWRGYAGAVVAVAVITALASAFHSRTETPSNFAILYVLAVLASAVAFGRGPALACAVLAFLVNDFLFTPPVFQISPFPDEWLQLGVFIVVGVVTALLGRDHNPGPLEDKLRRVLAAAKAGRVA